MNNYRHVTIAFILTALLLAAIVGVYQYQQQKINSLISQKVTDVTPTPISHPEQSEGSTTNWQTYKNDSFGFSLKIPNNWTINESNRNYPSIDTNTKSWAVGGGPSPTSMNYFIGFENIPSNFNGWLKSMGSEFANHFSYTETTLGEYKAYVTTSLPDMFSNYSVFISNNNQLIKVTLNPFDVTKSDDVKVKAIFDQILSTFKFTQ